MSVIIYDEMHELTYEVETLQELYRILSTRHDPTKLPRLFNTKEALTVVPDFDREIEYQSAYLFWLHRKFTKTKKSSWMRSLEDYPEDLGATEAAFWDAEYYEKNAGELNEDAKNWSAISTETARIIYTSCE